MRESRYKNTIAIILKKKFLGENDLLLTMFSPHLGKFQIISKSSRKILSTKGSHIDILNLVNIQLYQKLDRYLLIQCQAINTFTPIKDNIQSTLVAQVIAEIIYRSTDGIEENAILFQLILDCLNSLEKSHNLLLSLEHFKIKLLDKLGLLPDLDSCPLCHQHWPIDQIIYLQNDHFLICGNCAQTELPTSLISITFPILKLLNYLATANFNQLKINLKNKELIKLQTISRHLFNFHIQQEIKSERILFALQ